jgi:hypothetical protein
MERDFAIGKFEFTPYATGEIYYDTRFDSWNRNELSVGVEVPLRRRSVIEFYFLRKNTSKTDTPHVNGFGLVFQLHL